jgi:PAS domain S-box-containing protein
VTEQGAIRTEDGRSVEHDRARRIERQLEVAQQITHIGSWEWDARTNAVTWSDELYRIYGLEPRSCVITLEFFLARLHEDDRARVQGLIGEAIQRGERFTYPERIVRPDGSVRHLDTVGEAARDAEGRVVGLIGTCRDVTERTRARKLQAAEQRILEMIASDTSLDDIMVTLLKAIEEHSPPTIASIVLLSADGKHLKDGAAPGLPEAYRRAIDGAPIGPAAGSCGTAMFLKQAVVVTDIETDPLWADYRALAREHGLRACWSSPIIRTDGYVLGSFALYHREPCAPDADDRQLIERATHLAGIAIERRQLEDQLRAFSEHVETVREDERTGIAREIHDELGQALTALKMDLAWVARRLAKDDGTPRETLLQTLRSMSDATDGVIDVVRRISAELRPGVLDDLGLLAAVEWQAQEFERRTGSTCEVVSNLGDVRLSTTLSTAVFRIFQESLTNVARHAEATSVEVKLDRDGDTLSLSVQDDGKGIPAEAMHDPRSLGLLGISERARRLGGSVTIGPASPRGTLVSVRVPCTVEASS